MKNDKIKILLACDTYEPHPWNRDRLPAVKKALGNFKSEIIDIYEFNSREEAHLAHEEKVKFFLRNKDKLAEFNEKIYNKIVKSQCNIAIFATVDNYSNFIFPETILKLREKNIFTVGTLGDDEFLYHKNKFIVPLFDKVIAYVKNCVDQYNNIIPDSCYYLPNSCHFPEKNFDNLQIDEKDKKHDVLLMGAPHLKRPEIVRKLISNGVKVSIFGSAKWKEYEEFVPYYHGYAPSGDIDKILKESKIILALLEDHVTGGLHMNTKIWDSVKNGQMCIATKYEPLTEDYGFIENEEIVMYKSIDDLVKKTKYYLENPKKRLKIAKNLFKKTSKDFDYEKLYNELFTKICNKYTQKIIDNTKSEKLVTIVNISGKKISDSNFNVLNIGKRKKWKNLIINDFWEKISTPYFIITSSDNHYSLYIETLLKYFPDELKNGIAFLRKTNPNNQLKAGFIISIDSILWKKDKDKFYEKIKQIKFNYFFSSIDFKYNFGNIFLFNLNKKISNLNKYLNSFLRKIY